MCIKYAAIFLDVFGDVIVKHILTNLRDLFMIFVHKHMFYSNSLLVRWILGTFLAKFRTNFPWPKRRFSHN